MINLAKKSPPRVNDTNTNHLSGEKQNMYQASIKQTHEQKQKNTFERIGPSH